MSRPVEQVHYFGEWVEVPSKQTDRTVGGWVQTTFSAKAEQIRRNVLRFRGKLNVKLNGRFVGKTSLRKNFQMISGVRGGGWGV